jgi:sugar diacid utilization regulator
VPSLAALLQAPPLRPLIGYVARPRHDPEVQRVAVAEALDQLGAVEAGAIVLLTRAASAEAGSYRFDVGLRRASAAGAAAVVLRAPDVERLSQTAAAIAARSDTAILGTTADADLADLAVAIARELAGDADAALVRAHTAVRAVAAHPHDGSSDALLRHVSAAIGIPLAREESEGAGPRAPILVEDRVEGWLTAREQDGDLGLALEIALHAAASATGRALARQRRAEQLPILSAEEVLSELLSAPARARSALARRARSLGLAIDGWHVVARLEPAQLADAAPEPELDAYERRRELARAALRAVRGGDGEWHSARAEQGVVLVRTSADDPGFAASADVARQLDEALAGIRSRTPATTIRCGVGGAHAGSDGLLSSAAEAKAALTAARASGRVNQAAPFDSLGLRRTLVEWYASDTARESMASVLAPLVDLGGARAERLIQTLHVYLDHQCSITKTAATLNLHRNAVSYRVNQIFALLDVDQHNPDDLLLLQLACRARDLA